MQETWVRSLGWEDPLEEDMATHSSILAGEFHGQRGLAGHSLWGRKESDTIERLSLSVTVKGCHQRTSRKMDKKGLPWWSSVKTPL